MPFYHFDQNNTGGQYDVSETLAPMTIIEADTPEQANAKGEELGMYFRGVRSGIDCPCCGDRWYRDTHDHARITPEHVGRWRTVIHFADGKSTTIEGDE